MSFSTSALMPAKIQTPSVHVNDHEGFRDDRATVTLIESRTSGRRVTLFKGLRSQPVTVTEIRTTEGSITMRDYMKASQLKPLLPPLQQQLKNDVDREHSRDDVFSPLHPVLQHHYNKAMMNDHKEQHLNLKNKQHSGHVYEQEEEEEEAKEELGLFVTCYNMVSTFLVNFFK